jgi:hypothetical protein
MLAAGQKLVTGARDVIATGLDISCDCIERVLPQASVDILPGHDFMPSVLGLLRAVADKGGGLQGDVQGAQRCDAGDDYAATPGA